MKKILLFLFAVLISFPLAAQEKTPSERARLKANRFAKKWELESRQRDNAYAIYLAQERDLDEIADLETTDSAEYRKQRKEIRAKAEEKLVLSLNKYQRKEYEKEASGKKKRKKKRRRRG